MEHQDELFQLIKSLSKSEKKFFTQYVNLYEKGASPIYLQVFNFLNDEEDYSEERLFKKFRDQSFRKNYPVTKHYLKQLIIKTLRHGDLTMSDDRDLTVYVLDIKRLMAKGLMLMAKRMIEKLKAEGYEEEKFNDVLQLITMQRGLIYHGYYRHEPEINLDTLDDEEDTLLEKMKQLRQLMNASLKLGSLMDHENGTLPTEMVKEIEALADKGYLKNYEKLSSAKAKHTYLQFWAQYYCGLGDYKKYYEYASRKLEFVKHEKIPRTVSNWLVVGYNHYLEASLLTGNFTEFETRLQFLEEMELKTPFHDANRFQTVSIFSLLYFIKQNNEKKINKYIQYSEEGLVRLAPFIHKAFVYTLRTIIAYAYLRLKKRDECLKEVNDLLALTSDETRRDYVGHVKVINLMLRFEMKEFNYLSYLLKNTYRFFVSYLYTSPVHKFIIAYLKDALKTKGRLQMQEVNETYVKMLANLKFNPNEGDIALGMMIEDFLKMDKEKIEAKQLV